MTLAVQPSVGRSHRLVAWLHRLEDLLSSLVMAAMAGIPIAEMISREWLRGSIPGSIPVVQHLTLWITFLGATLAARSDRLLALSAASFLPPRWQERLRVATSWLAALITGTLLIASLELVAVDREYGDTVAWGLPVWLFTAIMPFGFGLIGLRLVHHAAGNVGGRLLCATGLLVPLVIWFAADGASIDFLAPGIVLIVVATALGMPIFAAIGGVALLLFLHEGTPLLAVPGETYRMSTSPMLPAIPLFTLAGYILAEGGSSRRLLRFCTALVGWMPGGLAVVTTLVLAFFTPLTGASGITILAMGGLLLPMLVKGRYRERNAVGVVTVSGSIGVLFPPSLPVILYAYYAEVDLARLFVGGLVPGLVLVTAVALWGAYSGWRGGAVRTPFRGRELLAAAWQAKWELMLPAAVLFCLFGGFATLVEAAALTVAYALVLECAVFRELNLRRDAVRVAIESAAMIGGFMIILGVALGLTNYFIIAQIPMRALELVQEWIQSPILFLLALNVLLIVVGALMDIYSAIIVIVPLIAPMASAYAIDPVHLGIIFLANAQLGYLMPPMGENLFLSAYRFDRPLAWIYRSTLPYVGILLVAVLLITYAPPLTLWLVEVTGV